ncbi:MAG TPA: recombinase family protein [Acidimicrobiales bacterium]|nr:recombinase family protein [Acidimicrobiales bacterium]
MREEHEKVTHEHLRRNAYLYIRQSTLRQVVENTTSTDRQYGLRQRAVALGWAPEQVVVVDEDLGRSGASSEGREGFQRLVADVGMGKAGIVIGTEVSRLARNNADWHRLLEICALTETLILDEDGLYDPCTFNDRLVLGLKGQMSEAELHLLKARLRGGQLAKARTGELFMPLPVGFVYDPAARVVLDPDQGVRDVVAHLFATFARTGSARATVKAFAAEGLRFPSRVQKGPNKGALGWFPLRHHRVLGVLHNPRYAGAFAYGRRRARRGPDGVTRYLLQPRQSWTVVIPDAHPGYISWDRYEDNLARLAECAQARGEDRRSSPPREGPALLQGIVLCGRCGKRMTVRYYSRGGATVPNYLCQRTGIEEATAPCARLVGADVDSAVGELLVSSVSPLALEVALAVQQELEGRAAEADGLRHQAVERARHAAEAARRRYLSVDPDNRLVAASLEADWNEALRALSAAQEDYQRQSAKAVPLAEADKARVLALASDFPALWADPRTPQRERKRMVRLLVEDVTLVRSAGCITAQVRFKTGQTATLEVPVQLGAAQARRTSEDVVRAIDTLLDAYTEAGVAEELNKMGLLSGTKQAFHLGIVHHIRVKHGLAAREQRLRAKGLASLTETATRLGVCATTVKQWHHEGRLQGEPLNEKGEHYYVVPDIVPWKATGRPLGSKDRHKRKSVGNYPGGAV